ncbi:hypothetical protein LUZ63_001676 [Rhynchospora breviuscula]|uniref:Uncharacterized protein n=1 Tax=Rhynchospora breviuscula TaxID=2022672 RepID=A0A9Q0CXB9_9POAL|nr:hypothetical protein LUZ63_001676 [Rhynchospora breviuscula]
METPNSSSTSLSPSPPLINKNKSGRKLHRQRSRLQMHAPASIQVGPAEITSISNWQAPIPLLSPLDVSPVQHNYMSERDHDRPVDDMDATSTATAASAVAASGAMWRHPAEPFYYEPLPGCTPGFVFSNCA